MSTFVLSSMHSFSPAEGLHAYKFFKLKRRLFQTQMNGFHASFLQLKGFIIIGGLPPESCLQSPTGTSCTSGSNANGASGSLPAITVSLIRPHPHCNSLGPYSSSFQSASNHCEPHSSSLQSTWSLSSTPTAFCWSSHLGIFILIQ